MSDARFDLVIFDNDGVLVDSEVHAQRITAALISELGVPMTPAASRRPRRSTTHAAACSRR